MTDFEIIQGLINRDNAITQEFFFERCRPLFYSIIQNVFSYEVDYDEFVNELYLYLMHDDGKRLRQFQGRSSLFLWLKVTATRFFIKKRRHMIENTSHEPLSNGEEDELLSVPAPEEDRTAAIDVENLLNAMPNQRYADVLRQLLLMEVPADKLAAQMDITVDNLYNIKRRAMMQLMQVAVRDIHYYGKR